MERSHQPKTQMNVLHYQSYAIQELPMDRLHKGSRTAFSLIQIKARSGWGTGTGTKEHRKPSEVLKAWWTL